MEKINNDLIRQVIDLQSETRKTKAAANFLFYSIVEMLDQQSGEGNFSEVLKAKLNSELSKINDGSASVFKRAINEIMQPPTRQRFSNTKPFLK